MTSSPDDGILENLGSSRGNQVGIKKYISGREIYQDLGVDPHYLNPDTRIGYAKDLLNSGTVKCFIVSDKFNSPEIRNEIVSATLTAPWLLPRQEFENQLPFQASTGHKASSASLILDPKTPEYDPTIKIVAKRFSNPMRARREIDLLRKSLNRGIQVIEPFGWIEVNDQLGRDGFSITLLREGIIPLASIRLEGIRRIVNDEKVETILQNLGAFIADCHNKGLDHGDLHAGNIGVDLQPNTPSFVLFDLERAHLLGSEKLTLKKNSSRVPHTSMKKGFDDIENRYLKDLARLIACMVISHQESFQESFVKDAILRGYRQNREKEQSQLTDEEYTREFEKYYQIALMLEEKVREKRIRVRKNIDS